MAENFKVGGKLIKSDTVLINVQGHLDAHTFEQLDKVINAAFNKNIFKIIVNMEKVDYISSAGAGVFIGALSRTQENEGNIVLLNPSDPVTQVFDILGLSLLFPVAENYDEAMQSL